MRRGKLFIVSAPSGTGKTTLVESLVKRVPDLVMSRSYTSRPPRAGEVDAVDYNFIDPKRFAEMVEGDAFLEWATIFGNRYGTCAADTETHQVEGRDVVLVIDVQGAEQVRRRGIDVVGIFVMPPSFEALEERLRGRSRAETSEEELQKRLTTARSEVEARHRYDFIVINDEVSRCVDRLRSIVMAERSRAAVVNDVASAIAATFVPESEPGRRAERMLDHPTSGGRLSRE
jgi:guanylate kinase